MAELQHKADIITGTPSEVGCRCNEVLKASVSETNIQWLILLSERLDHLKELYSDFERV